MTYEIPQSEQQEGSTARYRIMEENDSTVEIELDSFSDPVEGARDALNIANEKNKTVSFKSNGRDVVIEPGMPSEDLKQKLAFD